MSDTISVPAVLGCFADPSGLLPGGDRQDFEAIRQMMIDDTKPENQSGVALGIRSCRVVVGDLAIPSSQAKNPAGFSRTGDRIGIAAIRRRRHA
jgi:hypothetical protein